MPLKLNRADVVASWEPYVRQIADMLGLRDWVIGIGYEFADEGYIAQVSHIDGRKVANVSLSDKFLDDSPEDQRSTIVHELLHLHHTAADSIASELIPKDAYNGWDINREYAIDGLAVAIAPLFPLPTEDIPHGDF